MFDAALNRLSYSELLQPDIGYHLEFAVGLTYSLDLEALLGVPVSLGLLDEADSELMKSPFYLLEAIRKSSDQIAIFCNAGSISLPSKIQSVYSLLENSVFEIKLANKQNFHPKIWIIKYTNYNGESMIKLLVLSRNLTFDTSIDLCVALQGKINPKKSQNQKNQPLSDLLHFVMPYSEKNKRKKIEALANDIMCVESFDLEHPFEDYTFLPLGIPGHDKHKTTLFDHKFDLFTVSPFLSDDVVKELTNCPYKKTLITRKSSITSTVMNEFDDVYITKDLMNDNEYGLKQDIHAKLYFTTTNNGNYLYIGSANASHNAFHKNIEFLVKFKYKHNCMGIKTFINDFIPEENCPYEKIVSVPEREPLDESEALIEKAIKDAIYALKSASITSEGHTYDVRIESKPLKTQVEVKLAPIHRQDLFLSFGSDMVFKKMLLKELSEFYVLMVRDKKIVIKISTKGIPEDRDDAIYNSIIDSRSKFLSYISFVLSDDYSLSAFEDLEAERLLVNNGVISDNRHSFSAIYEKMLKIAHENPSRFKEIADIIKRLDPKIVGSAFLEMHQEFEKAVRRMKK